ncbi:tetratricopeptide repeat protein [Flagellimonas myxillae]|uniref:tetratricopeptide repeat protein n=1 Tax=Flagellimonas myxillae TaxID=2942214 RepID=UPI00201ECCD1|nr:tetratricopeptide repeat protein [Muricauda myxillae]MCL6267136.1 tetratricopeptide repeat protein [Muricauda myxillae]
MFAIKAGAQSPAFTIADSLYQLGNYVEAINAYAKEGNEKSSLQIARAYTAIGNNEKAIAQYLDIIDKNPNQVLAKFELGKLHAKTKKWEKAQLVFENLTVAGTENPEFYYYLGSALQKKGDSKNGNEALKKAVELDSTHLRSIYLLGKFYVGAELPSMAHEILDLGLRSAPSDPALINLKALTYFNNGNFVEAITLFERLLEMGEFQPFIFKKLGYAYFKNWEFDKAKKNYRSLEQIPNFEADAYFGLGEVYLMEKQLDSSKIFFKKSIEERRYVFDEEYKNLGRIARLQNRLKESLDYYTKAWEENKADFFSYYQVCIMADEYYKDPETKLRNYQKFLDDFDRAPSFLRQRVKKRVSELKEEMHFAKK